MPDETQYPKLYERFCKALEDYKTSDLLELLFHSLDLDDIDQLILVNEEEEEEESDTEEECEEEDEDEEESEESEELQKKLNG